ncbi:hypothetical protein GCM10029964_096370 [Kibdelosporangium lantanae]
MILPSSGETGTLTAQPPFPALWVQRLPDGNGTSVVSASQVLYTVVYGDPGNVVAVLHSTDAGRTWQADSPEGLEVLPVEPYVSPADELVIVGDHMLYIADEDGRSWREVRAEPPFSGYSRQSRAGNLATVASGTPTKWSYRLSTATDVVTDDIPAP